MRDSGDTQTGSDADAGPPAVDADADAGRGPTDAADAQPGDAADARAEADSGDAVPAPGADADADAGPEVPPDGPCRTLEAIGRVRQRRLAFDPPCGLRLRVDDEEWVADVLTVTNVSDEELTVTGVELVADGRDPLQPRPDPESALFVPPDAVVELSAADSIDPSGDGLCYLWSVPDAPDGSQTAVEDPVAPAVTLRPDAGVRIAPECSSRPAGRRSATSRATSTCSAPPATTSRCA